MLNVEILVTNNRSLISAHLVKLDQAEVLALAAAADWLNRYVYLAMTADAGVFRAFKTPDVPAPLDPELFMSLMDMAAQKEKEALEASLSELEMGDLFSLLSVTTKLRVTGH